MKRPTELTPHLNWCEIHGGWDPTSGLRQCNGCVLSALTAKQRQKLYALHPLDGAQYSDHLAMQAPNGR